MAIVIFRQYNDALNQLRANLYAELQAGRLRQGWGLVGNGASMALRDAQGDQIPIDAWAGNFIQARPACWGPPNPTQANIQANWDAIQIRYQILTRMLQIQLNDIVIVPKTPADTAFSVACVSEFEPGISYRFDPPNWIAPCGDAMPCPDGHIDFGHIISVNPDSVETYPNHHDPNTDVIADIIRGAPFMSAVNIAVNTPRRAYLNELRTALAGLGFECPA